MYPYICKDGKQIQLFIEAKEQIEFGKYIEQIEYVKNTLKNLEDRAAILATEEAQLTQLVQIMPFDLTHELSELKEVRKQVKTNMLLLNEKIDKFERNLAIKYERSTNK